MWKPKSAYYPVDANGEIEVLLVNSYIGFNDVLSFVGVLEGDGGWRVKTRKKMMVLAWRRDASEKSFMVYTWGSGHQERVGTVKVEYVKGLDTAPHI